MMSSTVSRSSGPKLSYAIVMPFALTWPLRTGIAEESGTGGFATGSEETGGEGMFSGLREQPRSAPAASRAAGRKTLRTRVFMKPPGYRGRAAFADDGRNGPLRKCVIRQRAAGLSIALPNAGAKRPGPPARTLKLGEPGRRPRSASAAG